MELKIFYNEKCNFCVNIKKIIEKLDSENKIQFEPLNDEEAELKAVDKEGKEYLSEELVPVVAEVLPGIKRFAWMFKGEMGKKTSSLFYQGLERAKKAHNKIYDSCTGC